EIIRLFDELPAFRSLKIETVPAGPKYSAVLKQTKGRLHVSGGWAVNQLIDALDRGVHAFMPTAMDKIYVAIYSAYHSGKREAARALFEKLLPALAFANQNVDVSIRFFKMLRYTEGLFSSDICRPPIKPFDAHQRMEAARLIRHVTSMQSDLGSSTSIRTS
ncbi:MAG: dihydrodipicolinate synthase family protein, partial [Pseudomonadota bacterium]